MDYDDTGGIYLRNYHMDPQTNDYTTIPRRTPIVEPYYDERTTRFQHPYQGKYKAGFEDDITRNVPLTRGTLDSKRANIPQDHEQALINNENRYSLLHNPVERENFNDSNGKWWNNEIYVMYFVLFIVLCYVWITVHDLKYQMALALYRRNASSYGQRSW